MRAFGGGCGLKIEATWQGCICMVTLQLVLVHCRGQSAVGSVVWGTWWWVLPENEIICQGCILQWLQLCGHFHLFSTGVEIKGSEHFALNTCESKS